MLSSARNQYLLRRIERMIERVMASQAEAGKRGKFVPWRAELEFGDGKPVPALVLKTPAGNELRLKGKIDRVDKVPERAEFAVIDYKFRGSTLALDWAYHGLSLQLLTYLLVLERASGPRSRLVPTAAFYVRLLGDLEKIRHPDDATSPDDPAFHLRDKPRGILDFSSRHLVDAEHNFKASDVVNVYIKSDGTLGNRNNSDACERAEFSAMLKLAERKLTELADQIISGRIDPAPYRSGQLSPCAGCEYGSICRFELPLNRYRMLPRMTREQVLAKALEEAARDE
jgi:ATP-dependent helicase/nuclease subunit B